jgi:hypothetical protein
LWLLDRLLLCAAAALANFMNCKPDSALVEQCALCFYIAATAATLQMYP